MVKNYTTRINTLLRIYTVYLGYFFILYLTVEEEETGSKYIEYLKYDVLFVCLCCDTTRTSHIVVSSHASMCFSQQMATQNVQTEVLVPKAYGPRWITTFAPDSLPITGGTMRGNIDMAGFKIVNLGQANIQTNDAVNLETVENLITTTDVSSTGVSASSTVPSKPYTFVSVPASLGSLSFDGILPLFPGTMNPSTGINDTNWTLNALSNGLSGYSIGTNNIPLQFKTAVTTVKFTILANRNMVCYLAIFTPDGSLVHLSSPLVVEGQVRTTTEISIPFGGQSYDSFSTFSACLFCNMDIIDIANLTITDNQLVAMNFRFSY